MFVMIFFALNSLFSSSRHFEGILYILPGGQQMAKRVGGGAGPSLCGPSKTEKIGMAKTNSKAILHTRSQTQARTHAHTFTHTQRNRPVT